MHPIFEPQENSMTIMNRDHMLDEIQELKNMLRSVSERHARLVAACKAVVAEWRSECTDTEFYQDTPIGVLNTLLDEEQIND
jgi:hypothetical protein